MSTYSEELDLGNVQEALVDAINSLRFKSPGVMDVAIVSIEGLPITSYILDDIEGIRFSAMTAAMLSLGERAANELKKGDLKKILIEGEHGYILTVSAGDDAVLTVSTNNQVKLGLLFLELNNMSKKVSKILAM